ncbi:M48 family metallopeptidase [Streptomyces beihaiensis]|uniref:M48 family metallopeptidase n=1 Tax=Streptomyces beihaiensis TaxID=2984495 RepID=A0ABT3TQX8_9ACTN|nr:M48 family metallopeptidase [Streptomyces beihaiensis]MCX3059452.1 M48 family metallopeptidase [Streptomyces beihaiensis]
MGSTLRAARALILLLGFYLIGFILLGALGALDWGLVSGGHVGVGVMKLVILSVIVAIPVVQGLFVIRSPKFEPPAGVRVDEHAEPRLWAAVRRLAEQTGTRAPDEIYLVAEVNAAVHEESRLLGLRSGRRVLLIGVPLLTGLDEAQLMGVLAHEFGHYSNADTRLGAINRRGFEQISRTVTTLMGRAEAKRAQKTADGEASPDADSGQAGLSYRLAAKPFIWYGAFYVRSMRGAMRRAEFAADHTAARIAGRDAVASALREIPVLDTAFGFYLNSYATLGTGAGLLPPPGEFYGGLRHLLSARHDELDKLRRELPQEEPSPYDTHPPIAERVARIEQLADDGRAATASGPGTGLLADPAAAFAAVEQVSLTPRALAMRRAEDWPQLVHASMTTYAANSAEPLREAVRAVRGGDGSLADTLAAVDAGTLWQIADHLPKSEEAAAATGRAAREFARPRLRAMLSALVTGELIGQGAARFELSWTGPAELRMADGLAERVEQALDAAVADVPDTSGLRQTLAVSA